MNSETTTGRDALALRNRVNQLLALDQITLNDIEDLNKFEREYLSETLTETAQRLKGPERDNFLNKIEPIMNPNTKAEVWDHNHARISKAISAFMSQHGIMPTRNAIADETGLSRQTVSKHFAAYQQRPEQTAEMEQFIFMAPNILANVYKYALTGDMRAARLYLEMVGAINKKQGNTVVNEQNSYIQINNTILSQENLKQLSAKQLNQIESIITKTSKKNLLKRNKHAAEAGRVVELKG
jgi:hypothetical protein